MVSAGSEPVPPSPGCPPEAGRPRRAVAGASAWAWAWQLAHGARVGVGVAVGGVVGRTVWVRVGVLVGVEVMTGVGVFVGPTVGAGEVPASASLWGVGVLGVPPPGGSPSPSGPLWQL